MQRRAFLAATAATLAAPAIVRAQSATTLKFVPHADLATLDPVWTTADITRNFSLAVFDTLYGLDAQLNPQPQMVAGDRVEDGGKLWEITLRSGLKFHDGSPVLARDAVASIKRAGQRSPVVNILVTRASEITAVSDTVIRIRLKQPFSLVRDALAETTVSIMPERIAATSGNDQIKEIIGSGPFTMVAAERVPGAKVVYARFPGYLPRSSGTESFTAGPKVAHFDRVEWLIMPDEATKAAAIGNGEIDWWENPSIDLLPQLRKNSALTLQTIDPYGSTGCMRFNHLFAPFNNAAIRRAVLSGVDQNEFTLAYTGADPSVMHNPVGLFAPGSPYATTIGCEAVGRVKDVKQIQKDLAAAGYKGERVVLLGPTTIPALHAYAEVTADYLKRIGMNVDYQALDWGTVVQRRASKEPIDKGGWNIFITTLGGSGNVSPVSDTTIRSGQAAWFGWPDMPKMEALRDQWLDAPDLASQKKIVEQMQMVLWEEVPYVPLGFFAGPTVYRNSLTGVHAGFPQMYGVKRA